MNLSVTLAWRYLSGRGRRSLLTTLAVALGVMLSFGLNGISPALESAFNRNLVASAGSIELSVTDASGQPFAASVADQLLRIPGVAAVSPEIERAVILPQPAGGDSDSTQITLIGVDPGLAPQVRDLTVASGRMLAPGDGAVTVMPAETAKTLGLALGDGLSVPSAVGTVKLRLVGILNAAAVPGSEQIYLPLATARQIFSLAGRVTAVQASVAEGADRAQVQGAVQAALGTQFSVGGLASNSSLLASLQVTSIAFTMFSLFALATAGFIILNSFRTLVADRRRDIGMLRAIGARRRTILRMFLAESVLQGLAGTALGMILGWLMAAAGLAGMSSLTRSILHLEIGGPEFSVQTWVTSILLGVGVTVVAALVPARAAARISPLEAMRPRTAEVESRQIGRGTWIGVALIALSVFGLFSGSSALLGIGSVVFLVGIALVAPALVTPAARALGRPLELAYAREGVIARGNVLRNPSRSGLTVTVVMFGLAAIVAMVTVVNSIFTGFTGYLDRSMSSDYLIIPQSIVLGQGNVAAGPQLARRVADVPGIEAVTTLRLAQARVGDGSVQVIGIDPDTYLKVGGLDWNSGSSNESIQRLRTGRWVIANGIYASQHSLQVGSQLALQTPNGLRTYLVAGIGNDYLNAKLATLYTSQDNLARDFNVTSDLMVLADRSPGADPETVTVAVNRVVADFPAFRLWESTVWKAEQAKTFNSSMIVFDVLIAALALPSLLALVNTMAISVLARTREIGMLRAVGATRRQVARMITAESLLLSAIGTVLAIVAGLWLGLALVQAMGAVGWEMPFSFPWAGIAVAVVVGVGFGILAARGPARTASRMPVVEALHQE